MSIMVKIGIIGGSGLDNPDILKDVREIDLKWYKKMIKNYIQGAFGLSDIEETEQKGLDAWM